MIERQMGLKRMTETKHVKRGGGKGRGWGEEEISETKMKEDRTGRLVENSSRI